MARYGQHTGSRGYPQHPADGCPPRANWVPGAGADEGAVYQQSPAAPSGARPQSGWPAGYAPMPYGQVQYRQPATSVSQAVPKRRRGVAFWVAIAVALIALIVAGVLAFTMLSGPARGTRSGQAGQLDGKTADEIQAELDRVVEEGMFNISIAAIVEFADGRAPGDLRIENVPGNPYLMKVDIKRQDTGERIYETDIIEQNHHIQSDVLDVDLDPGTYECIASFHALDPATEEEVGQAAAAITIKVLG